MLLVLVIFWTFSGINRGPTLSKTKLDMHFLRSHKFYKCHYNMCSLWLIYFFVVLFKAYHIISQVVKIMCNLFCIELLSVIYICVCVCVCVWVCVFLSWFWWFQTISVIYNSIQHTYIKKHTKLNTENIHHFNNLKNNVHAFNNTTKIHMWHKDVMLHYNDTCKICEISEITKCF
jgi:hypothetical protein